MESTQAKHMNLRSGNLIWSFYISLLNSLPIPILKTRLNHVNVISNCVSFGDSEIFIYFMNEVNGRSRDFIHFEIIFSCCWSINRNNVFLYGINSVFGNKYNETLRCEKNNYNIGKYFLFLGVLKNHFRVKLRRVNGLGARRAPKTSNDKSFAIVLYKVLKNGRRYSIFA